MQSKACMISGGVDQAFRADPHQGHLLIMAFMDFSQAAGLYSNRVAMIRHASMAVAMISAHHQLCQGAACLREPAP